MAIVFGRIITFAVREAERGSLQIKKLLALKKPGISRPTVFLTIKRRPRGRKIFSRVEVARWIARSKVTEREKLKESETKRARSREKRVAARRKETRRKREPVRDTVGHG